MNPERYRPELPHEGSRNCMPDEIKMICLDEGGVCGACADEAEAVAKGTGRPVRVETGAGPMRYNPVNGDWEVLPRAVPP
jgi:hypothetical protein